MSKNSMNIDLFKYRRFSSSEVIVGNTPIGGNNPIRLQSMTNKSTMDTIGCVTQAKLIIAAGGEIVRLTTQGLKEARNLKEINIALRSDNIMTPLVADVHFNPAVADVAALYAEKVRINPGNYVDPARTFKHLEYTNNEYEAELKRIRDRFTPFLKICKDNNTAIRIGVNHGSLSDRIMCRYGNTPQGMVESCMEFLRICIDEDFKNVIISIKASNTVIMVKSVRLLLATMIAENIFFPIHLGVTEAGQGEDGRVKSAVGIGALLADGIGDTIRVSLSEAPEKEIPVAALIRDYITSRSNHSYIPAVPAKEFNYLNPERRHSNAVGKIGGLNPPVVIGNLTCEKLETQSINVLPDEELADIYYCGENPNAYSSGKFLMLDYPIWKKQNNLQNSYPVFVSFGDNFNPTEVDSCQAGVKFLFVNYMAMTSCVVDLIRRNPEIVIISQSNHVNRLGEHRAIAHTLMAQNIYNPLLIFQHYNETDINSLRIKAATDCGVLLIDGLTDGLFLINMNPVINHTDVERVSFSILQATRSRITRTEYISCPGCGRTLFNLEETISNVKSATNHLKGLKIAIMGCIVNGPGEMADADYGYVGAGRGKISLYRGKECIKKNLPEESAVESLLELINSDIIKITK